MKGREARVVIFTLFALDGFFVGPATATAVLSRKGRFTWLRM